MKKQIARVLKSGHVLAELVEKNIALWEKNHHRRMNAEVKEEEPYCPVITIARQMGAGGPEIAELIGKKLGYQVLDRKIIDAIATRTGHLRSAVATIDERAVGIIEDVLRATFLKDALPEDEYLKHLIEVLHIAAEHGKSVIVGRAANLLIREYPAFRVRIICPVEKRIERTSINERISLERAEEKIRLSDSAKNDFLASIVGEDNDSGIPYDVIINTEIISYELASEMICHAYDCLFSGAKKPRCDHAAAGKASCGCG